MAIGAIQAEHVENHDPFGGIDYLTDPQKRFALRDTKEIRGISLHSGFPMALYTNANDPTNTGSRGLRPNCNGTNTVWGRRDATASQGGGFVWFNPSNYSDPTTTFGTCAPQLGHLRGPGYYNWDISLQKNFQLTERFRLQFRTDFLNAFNYVNLAVPNTTVNVSTTGVINASQPARNIQFALKLYY